MTPTSPALPENARKLAAYFVAFNSADEGTWEKAFEDT